MKVSCYQLDAGRTLAATSKAEALDRWRAGDGMFWLDLSEYDRESLEGLLDEVGVTRTSAARCLASALSSLGFARGWPV